MISLSNPILKKSQTIVKALAHQKENHFINIKHAVIKDQFTSSIKTNISKFGGVRGPASLLGDKPKDTRVILQFREAYPWTRPADQTITLASLTDGEAGSIREYIFDKNERHSQVSTDALGVHEVKVDGETRWYQVPDNTHFTDSNDTITRIQMPRKKSNNYHTFIGVGDDEEFIALIHEHKPTIEFNLNNLPFEKVLPDGTTVYGNNQFKQKYYEPRTFHIKGTDDIPVPYTGEDVISSLKFDPTEDQLTRRLSVTVLDSKGKPVAGPQYDIPIGMGIQPPKGFNVTHYSPDGTIAFHKELPSGYENRAFTMGNKTIIEKHPITHTYLTPAPYPYNEDPTNPTRFTHLQNLLSDGSYGESYPISEVQFSFLSGNYNYGNSYFDNSGNVIVPHTSS